MRAMTHRGPNPVAFVVAALDLDPNTVNLCALTKQAGTRRRRLTGRYTVGATASKPSSSGTSPRQASESPTTELCRAKEIWRINGKAGIHRFKRVNLSRPFISKCRESQRDGTSRNACIIDSKGTCDDAFFTVWLRFILSFAGQVATSRVDTCVGD